MKNKILKSAILLLMFICCTRCMTVLGTSYPDASTILNMVAGGILPYLIASFVDFTDNTNWKSSQRKLLRGGFINKNTPIRISFAYLFRIKIDGKYFLVKNARGTNKYQPVGGVYKLHPRESQYLRQKFHAEDDDKIPVDRSSKGDYRLRFKNRYLRKFVLRFNTTKNRETINNLSREFIEELFSTSILRKNSFGQLTYTYVGRHMSELKFSEHFQCYELLLADIVEVKLSEHQEQLFRNLICKITDQYMFASDEQINSLGIDTNNAQLVETIGDHTKKILLENTDLLDSPLIKKSWSIDL